MIRLHLEWIIHNISNIAKLPIAGKYKAVQRADYIALTLPTLVVRDACYLIHGNMNSLTQQGITGVMISLKSLAIKGLIQSL